MEKYRSLGQQVSSEGVSSCEDIDAFQEHEFEVFEAKHGRRCLLRDVKPCETQEGNDYV